MTISSRPNTLAIANAIVSFAQSLTNPDTTPVYKQVQLGAIKDVVTSISNSGACLEVYANLDDSQHQNFGGKIRDEQSWYLLSMVSMDNAAAAEALIYQVRDALIVPFQTHATLGNAGSVFHSQIKPGSGKFVRINRNAQFLRAHIIELMTRQEWLVSTPPGVIG